MTRPSKYAATVALIGCAALLGACKEGGSATPMPQPGVSPASSPATADPSSPPSTALPFGGAPKVNNPLPSTALDQPPCTSALTDAQLQKLFGKVPTANPDDLVLGPTCRWSKPETGAMVYVGYTTKQRLGLSATYSYTQPKVKFWQVAPDVQGFPAVYYEMGRAKPTDECTMDVGLADDLALHVGVTIGRQKEGTVDPCEGARMVADMVITNVRGAA